LAGIQWLPDFCEAYYYGMLLLQHANNVYEYENIFGTNTVPLSGR
jgi:hypothetical protein